jgi:hypothetical protein
MYRNNAFKAEILFPRVAVSNQSDKYWVFGRENQQLTENTLRAPGSAAERIKQTISTDNYFCDDHSLARFIPDEERRNFTAGDVEQWATSALMDKIMLDEEVEIATLAADTTQYAAGWSTTLAGANQWSDASNPDPLIAVEAGKAQVRLSGNNPNLIMVGDPVFQVIRKHPSVRDAFKYTKPGAIGIKELASYFDVDQFEVCSAVKVDPQTGLASFVWGKLCVIAYVQPNPSMQDVSFGKTFVWEEAPGTVGGFGTEIGRVNPPSAKSDELAVHNYRTKKVTSNVSAYLVKNAVG